MKVTICGSITSIENMNTCKETLEKDGHTVYVSMFVARDKENNPITQEEFYRLRKSGMMELSWFEREKSRAIEEHFKKIEMADAILVTNYPKNDIEGYVGGNTLIEIGLAFYLKKKIYFLYPIPEISYKEELVGMKPIVINGDLSLIK